MNEPTEELVGSQDEHDDTSVSMPTPGLVRRHDYKRGYTIGRYMIIDKLGEGGMGAVYAAYDPTLDRKIALKLLHTRNTGTASKRLHREAEALARLSHPNVVHVYDSWTHGGDVIVAMELVEGESLKEWQQSEPAPDWRTIVRVYLEAARGIAAAHDKGMIHRDIKPANILIGNDGRVRVADFGLAAALVRRSRDHQDESLDGQNDSISLGPEDSIAGSTTSLGVRLNDQLTRTGTLMGTPAYMAPEQYRRVRITAAADQYSFCVSLYEALWRQLPFDIVRGSDTMAELRRAKLKGQLILTPPPDSTVPAWLLSVLHRGLATAPEDRYPSMHALIAALADDPLARRQALMRRLGLGAVTTGLAALAVLGWMRGREPSQRCENLDRELAGVWDNSTRDEVREAFLATTLSFAPDTTERVISAFDTYAQSWLDMRTEVCHAPQGNVATLRYLCLERRKSQLGALAEIFSHGADAEVVAEATQAARSLPPIDYCADTAALVARVPPPEDPAMRERFNQLQPRVARLQALRDAGKYREGVRQGKALLAELGEHDYAPLVAEVLYWTANLQERAGDYGEAETQARQSIRIAAKGKDDLLEARAWVLLLGVVGSKQKRFNKAEPIMEWMQTAVDRADDEETRAYASSNLGNVLQTMGRYQEATQEHQRALAIREQTLGSEHPDVAASLNNLGNVLQTMGRYQEARDAHERALAIRERTLGSEHPDVAMSLNNLGNVLQNMGRYQEAKAAYERALALRQKALGNEHPYVATSLSNLGRVLQNMGEYDEAMRAYEGAVIIRQNALGSEHPDVAISLSNLGRVLQDMGRYEEAASAHQRTLVIWEKSLGDAHPYVASALVGLGRASIGQGKLAMGALYLGRALAIRENALGAAHPELAHVLLGLGELALARNQVTQAVPVLERALALHNADLQPEIQLALARALWSQGDDRARARALATQALDTYTVRTNKPERAKAAEWLATH